MGLSILKHMGGEKKRKSQQGKTISTVHSNNSAHMAHLYLTYPIGVIPEIAPSPPTPQQAITSGSSFIALPHVLGME